MKGKVSCRKNVKVRFLGDTDYNSGLIWGGYEQPELFSGHCGPQNSAVNIQDSVPLLLLFFSRDIVHEAVVETNHFVE